MTDWWLCPHDESTGVITHPAAKIRVILGFVFICTYKNGTIYINIILSKNYILFKKSYKHPIQILNENAR